jgi:hypothetical protein
MTVCLKLELRFRNTTQQKVRGHYLFNEAHSSLLLGKAIFGVSLGLDMFEGSFVSHCVPPPCSCVQQQTTPWAPPTALCLIVFHLRALVFGTSWHREPLQLLCVSLCSTFVHVCSAPDDTMSAMNISLSCGEGKLPQIFSVPLCADTIALQRLDVNTLLLSTTLHFMYECCACSFTLWGYS